MRYLGVDYGLRKIGLAISEGNIATPLKVIEVRSLNDAVEKIKKVIKDEHVEELVIGVPESKFAPIKKFINIICRFVKVVEADETLSSKNAQRQMIKLGKGKKERSMEDAYSATLILQNYLDNL